jgi:hypothetical protein
MMNEGCFGRLPRAPQLVRAAPHSSSIASSRDGRVATPFSLGSRHQAWQNPTFLTGMQGAERHVERPR